MSSVHNYSILNLLNLKDENIVFNERFCSEERINGLDVKVFHGTLSYKPRYNYLPKHLCFNEFKSVKSAAGAMSFIFCDSDTGNIVDILEDRRLHVLKRYFSRYSKTDKGAVKTIIIDI